MASLEEIRSTRLNKLNLLKEKGINPYPVTSHRDISLKDASEEFESLSKSGEKRVLAGRIMSIRAQGAIIFFDLFDGTGRFQALLKKGEPISEGSFKLFAEVYDIGDFMEVKGTFFLTKKNEKTILGEEIRMLAKALLPMPEKWHGLQDIEERFRKRYLDIISNQEVRERFVKRSKIVSLIREFYLNDGYIETDLPNLQPLAGGATAAPFTTHHNALDMDFYLPIAQELYLKQLIVGGINKVFEIGKRFRNEGIDHTHNPEFTMLESQDAYSDARGQREFIEKLFKFVVKGLFGKLQFEYKGNIIDLEPKFEVLKYPDMTDEEYKKTFRPNLIQPTFLIDYPASFNPFAKRKEEDSRLIDRFQLVIGGVELVNAFSELNDPIDQKERYLEEDKKKEKGDNDISPSDLEYIEAMEYGMPPNGGIGIGIDRLVMLLTGTENIKEVILFPTLKPKEEKNTKELLTAVAILNSGIKMEKWQELNTIAHLTASFAAREGKKLFYKDTVKTKDDKDIVLNIQHAIMIKKADSVKEIREVVKDALSNNLKVSEFTREMIETTNDRKVEEITRSKNIDEVEFLGALVFGPKSIVDELTKDLELYK